MQLVLVTGLSGSGKSIALAVLEDAGFYCVDNLPASLLPETIRFLQDNGFARVAVSIDVRSGNSLPQLPQLLQDLGRQGLDIRPLFLEAKTETLVKRFSETRRRHPLSDGERSLTESIALEAEMLAELRTLAHRIDTSDVRPNTLRNWVRDLIDFDRSQLTLVFQSFGFKHGIPLDADMVFDVRCLPNPHYDPVLRPLTGLDAPVADFLRQTPQAMAMLEDIRGYLHKWLPCFIRDNRNYLTVAIGCTGGQHRSVFFCEQLHATFAPQQQALIRHRELAGNVAVH